jgi:TolB-like protein
MKKLTLLFFLTTSTLFAQTFDKDLEQVAKRMAAKLSVKNNLSIAVYPFYNNKKKKTDLSTLVSEDFTNYLNNYNSKFKIIDRVYMEQMMDEHRLNDEGLIDPSTAKQFGMIIAADVYITGKVHLFANNIRLNLVAINTQTGERVCSEYKKLPLDYDIAEFIGVDIKKRDDKANLYKSSNPNCDSEKVGDYCFINKQRQSLNVKISNVDRMVSFYRTITVTPGEKKCFNNLPTKYTYRYIAMKNVILIGDPMPQGEFTIKVCRSNFVILK